MYGVGVEVIVNVRGVYVFGVVTKVIASNEKRKVSLFSGGAITCDLCDIVDTIE